MRDVGKGMIGWYDRQTPSRCVWVVFAIWPGLLLSAASAAQPATSPAADVPRLIARLDDRSSRTRERAMGALLAMGRSITGHAGKPVLAATPRQQAKRRGELAEAEPKLEAFLTTLSRGVGPAASPEVRTRVKRICRLLRAELAESIRTLENLPRMWARQNAAPVTYLAKFRSTAPGPPSGHEVVNRYVIVVPIKTYRGQVTLNGRIAYRYGHWYTARDPFEHLTPGQEVLVQATEEHKISLDQAEVLLVALHPATALRKKLAEQASSLPFGWVLTDKGPASPWRELGDKAWPASARAKAGTPACAVTGRPMTTLDPAVRLSVAKAVKRLRDWVGVTLTVTNTSDKTVTVQPLLTDGNEILWHESLILYNHGYYWYMLGCKGVGKPVRPVVLRPKQSLSTPVYLKQVYSRDYQICLGDRAICVWSSSVWTFDHYKPKPPRQGATNR